MTTPYTILTPRLKICCPEPAMAADLATLVQRNLEHLRPWMPWATVENANIEVQYTRLRNVRAQFDLDQDYGFLIYDRNGIELLGSTGLHCRGPARSLEIGYWIDQVHTHHGLATETSAALTRAAFELLDALRVEIHCDPANTASAAVPARLGYTNDGTLRLRLVNSDGELRDEMVWSLLLSEYSDSPSANLPIEAYDALGRRLI